MTLRIALVTTSYPSDDDDASGHFVQAEARALERAGHEVRIITPRVGGAFGWPGIAARVKERPSRAFDAAAWVACARTELGRARVERVVAHWAVPCAWPIGLAANAELEVVSHGGDVRLLVAMPSVARRAIVRAIAARATRWRFVSESLRRALVGALAPAEGASLARIAHVEAAAIELPDASTLRTLGRAKRAEAGTGALAVAVARLVPGKRVDVALAHAARIGARIVVVGDGPERAMLEARAAALGVDARFVGKVARRDALAWISAADVLVHASREEGASTVLREARALGVPVAIID